MKRYELEQLLECVEYAIEQYETSEIEVISNAELDDYKKLKWNLENEIENL